MAKFIVIDGDCSDISIDSCSAIGTESFIDIRKDATVTGLDIKNSTHIPPEGLIRISPELLDLMRREKAAGKDKASVFDRIKRGFSGIGEDKWAFLVKLLEKAWETLT